MAKQYFNHHATRVAIVVLVERHQPRTRLGVGQANLAGLDVHLPSVQRHDLVAPASGQHQQPDRRRRMDRDRPFRLYLVQRLTATSCGERGSWFWKHWAIDGNR